MERYRIYAPGAPNQLLNRSTEEVFIYGLFDPRIDHPNLTSVTYIGKTNSPRARARGHWAVRNRNATPLSLWLRDLEKDDLRPAVWLLELVPRNLWRARERWWINAAAVGGADLHNQGPGGNGNDSWSPYDDPTAVDAALRDFCHGRSLYPTQLEFKSAGLGPLCTAAAELQTHDTWAKSLGLRRARWWISHENIEQALREFCEGRDAYPRLREFSAAKLAGLYEAAARLMPHSAWAEMIGLQYRDPHIERRWPDERSVRDGLRTYLADRSHYPTFAEFERDGMRTLYYAAREHLGHDQWREEFGLRSKRNSWTEAAVVTALKDFCRDRSVYPTQREFRCARLSGLYVAARNIHPHSEWAALFALEYRREWDVELISATLRRLSDDYGRYPTRREIKNAGLAGMLSAADKIGTSREWAARLGVKFASPIGRPPSAQAQVPT